MRLPFIIPLLVITLLMSAGACVSQSGRLDQPPSATPVGDLTKQTADLTLAGARIAIDAAVAEADKRGTTGTIAVADSTGRLVALRRIEGTFVAGDQVSAGKARTAALFRKPTRVFEEIIREGRTPMLNIEGFTPMQGGVPIVIEGQVVGAVGVSGASSAPEDEELAMVAVDAVAHGEATAALPSDPAAMANADARPPAVGSDPSLRDTSTLTTDGALLALAGAMAKARDLGATGTIAVVDRTGHLVALERIDGTFIAGDQVSAGKARTAALFRKPTRIFEEIITTGRTPMLKIDDFTPMQGGVPIVVDGEVVGAIGVSGAASAAQDEEIALAGAAVIAGTLAAEGG